MQCDDIYSREYIFIFSASAEYAGQGHSSHGISMVYDIITVCTLLS